MYIKNAYAQLQPTKNIGQEFDLGNPIYGYSSLGQFISQLTGVAFSIAAIMVVFYFIIGAFELITSQGDKAHIVSARSKIYHSIIGFILLMALFLIMQYVLPALGVDFLGTGGREIF